MADKNRSGGVNANAEGDINIGGSVVGRDYIETHINVTTNKRILANKRAITLIAVVVAVVLLLSLVLISSWGDIRGWYVNLSNISKAEAMDEAKQRLGPKVIEVIPFKNWDRRDQQYIAVLVGDPSFTSFIQPVKLYLLEGSKTTYSSPEPQFEASRFNTSTVANTNREWPTSFGVVDVDHDGNQEVFAINFGFGGNASYGVTIYLYDSIEGKGYKLDYGGALTEKPHLGSLPDVPKDAIRQWLLDKADETIKQLNLNSNSEWQIWEQHNGTGFYKGKLSLHEVEGKIPAFASVLCKIDDGTFEWVAFFKGPVVGYDKSRNVHFILYFPPGGFDYVGDMVSGENYLWLGLGKENGLVVYEKATQMMKVIPVPEINQKLHTGDYPLTTFNIRTDGRSLLSNDARLTLPTNINWDNEFAAAYNCQ
jgi:hypothetical protein